MAKEATYSVKEAAKMIGCSASEIYSRIGIDGRGGMITPSKKPYMVLHDGTVKYRYEITSEDMKEIAEDIAYVNEVKKSIEVNGGDEGNVNVARYLIASGDCEVINTDFYGCIMLKKKITPENAEWLLEKCADEGQRKLNRGIVRQYAKDIKNGGWDPVVSESITISDTGKVLNGNHRLHAIVEAGVPILSQVIVGADEKSYGKFDQGHKRVGADRIVDLNVGSKGNAWTCAYTMMCIARAGRFPERMPRKTDPKWLTTDSEIEAYMRAFDEENPGLIKEAIAEGRRENRQFQWNNTGVAVAIIAMDKIDRSKAAEFRRRISEKTYSDRAVYSYRQWAKNKKLNEYAQEERQYITWCAVANVWRTLYGFEPKGFRYYRNMDMDMIGFDASMFRI